MLLYRHSESKYHGTSLVALYLPRYRFTLVPVGF